MDLKVKDEKTIEQVADTVACLVRFVVGVIGDADIAIDDVAIRRVRY